MSKTMSVSWSDQMFAMRMQLVQRQLEDEAEKALAEEADVIQYAAIVNAPRKSGTLESAIVVVQNDEQGLRSVEIGIDPDAHNAQGVAAEDYGGELELHQEGGGAFSTNTIGRGPGTQAKGPKSGGAFIQRAVRDRVGTMSSRIARALRAALKKAGAK